MNIIETGDTVSLRPVDEKDEIQYKKLGKGLVVDDDDDEFAVDDELVVIQWSNIRTRRRKKDLVLINKGKHMFNKSALETGMFVRQRGGQFKIVMADVIAGKSSWSLLRDFTNDLKHQMKEYDIVAVYTTTNHDALQGYLSGHNLSILWEEKTPEQIELELLEKELLELISKYKMAGVLSNLISIVNLVE